MGGVGGVVYWFWARVGVRAHEEWGYDRDIDSRRIDHEVSRDKSAKIFSNFTMMFVTLTFWKS